MKGKTAIGCSDFKNCGFKIPFILFGKNYRKQIQDLVSKGKTSKLKGFSEHPADLKEGILSLDENFNIHLA